MTILFMPVLCLIKRRDNTNKSQKARCATEHPKMQHSWQAKDKPWKKEMFPRDRFSFHWKIQKVRGYIPKTNEHSDHAYVSSLNT